MVTYPVSDLGARNRRPSDASSGGFYRRGDLDHNIGAVHRGSEAACLLDGLHCIPGKVGRNLKAHEAVPSFQIFEDGTEPKTADRADRFDCLS